MNESVQAFAIKKVWGMKAVKGIFVLLVVFLISGCVTMGSQRLLLNQGVSFDRYDEVKHIVVEEAASNGFSELTSEIKPSKHNNWEGQLYFKLVTPNGTDQLFVELSKKDGRILVYMHGAGTRANPDSAIKAIQERLDKAGM